MRDEYTSPRRWPWVLLALFVLLLVLVVGAHWIWSAGAGRRLNAEVARIRAAGEPIEPGDFVVAAVPDADNAAIDLRKAARSLKVTSGAWQAYEKLMAELPLTDNELSAIDAAVAENLPAFDDVDIAMTKEGVDWKFTLRSPVINTLLPDVSEQRTLASLIHHRAMAAHSKGDDAAALRDLRRIEFIASVLEKQPWRVSCFVSIGMRGMVLETLQKMSPDLKLGGKGAASRQQVQEILAMLLDDKAPRQRVTRALQSERMMQLDIARCVANGTLGMNTLTGGRTPPAVAIMGTVARPIALADGAIMIRHTTDIMKAAEISSDYPTFRKNAPPFPRAVANNRVRHFLAAMFMPAFDRTGQMSYRHMTERRMAAVSLAIALYKHDHNGALPSKLEDLVPKYLPAVPLDPMSAGETIKFLPRPLNPIIYSVGDNGTNDGGNEGPLKDEKAPTKWHALDAVTHLTPQPRALAESEAWTEPISGVDAEGLGLTTRPATQPEKQTAAP